MNRRIKKVKKDWHFYFELFISTFCLSAFTFGGGYVIIPLMRKKFVDELNWIEEKEMLDLTAIAQSSPGAIAVNASILVGYRLAGFLGSFITILGTVLPPLITLSIISLFYVAFRESLIVGALLFGMQAAVAAVIVDVVINMAQSIIRGKNRLSILMMVIVFIANYFLKVNLMLIIIICGLIGALSTLYHAKKVEQKGELA